MKIQIDVDTSKLALSEDDADIYEGMTEAETVLNWVYVTLQSNANYENNGLVFSEQKEVE